ncbi:MAG: cytochrome P460 family protein [Planctomycetota bacterium]
MTALAPGDRSDRQLHSAAARRALHAANGGERRTIMTGLSLCRVIAVAGAAAVLALASCRSSSVAGPVSEATSASLQAVGSDTPIVFPAGYGERFENYLSLDRVQNDDQIIRLFANELAMRGPGRDGKLPFGSVLVGEVYKARRNAAGGVSVSQLGRRLRGDLALIAVMQRGEGFGQRHAPELQNGDWEFAAFKPDGSVAGKNLDSCRACHAPLTTNNHVFSIEHLMPHR